MSNFKRRKLAVIDLGSNSALLLLAERDEDGTITVLKEDSDVPRLGEGIRVHRVISDAAFDRLATCLSRFQGIIAQSGEVETFVTLTAAAREAENQDRALTLIKEKTGYQAEIIPPNEEARLSYISVTSETPEDIPSMVVDIGGGSTEVTWGLGPRFDGGRSLNLGTVKLLEGPLKNERPSQEDMENARKEIDRQLMRITPLGKLDAYYGTAGSFTHLASLDLELDTYHPTKVDRHPLTLEKVSQWIDRLSEMSREEILELPGIDKRRADVLLAGTLVMERLLEKFGNEAFLVMDRGVRFGKLYDQLRKFVPPVKFAS